MFCKSCQYKLMMEAASTSETSVNLYQSTRYNNLEDIHLNENLLEMLLIYYCRQDRLLLNNFPYEMFICYCINYLLKLDI
jgi:hypothetical protein